MPGMTANRALVKMLIAGGTQYVFGNHGSGETPRMDSIQDYPQPKLNLALQ